MLLGEQRHNGCEQFVTRRRRGCDLNPGPSAPESSTLTTRLPSHHLARYKCCVLTPKPPLQAAESNCFLPDNTCLPKPPSIEIRAVDGAADVHACVCSPRSAALSVINHIADVEMPKFDEASVFPVHLVYTSCSCQHATGSQTALAETAPAERRTNSCKSKERKMTDRT